ncbi:MAG: TetR/AcrR family transcriptional regulator [Pseudoramibacter sp.]
MDKRIIKTQNNLKNTLRQMVMEKPFEKISVTELCKRAKTSRITFYTYYSDKYDLLNQCFEDIQKEAVQRYEELEAENTEHKLNISCQHFIMVLIEVMGPFVDASAQEDSKAAATLFYHFVFQNLKMFKQANADQLKTHYKADQLDAFLSYGLWGFVFADKNKYDREQTVEDAKRLIDDLLASPIFETES